MLVSALKSYLNNEHVTNDDLLVIKDAEGNVKTIDSISRVGEVDPLLPEGESPVPPSVLIQLA
jgi:hypothetical protein